jgi:hypothetical protein
MPLRTACTLIALLVLVIPAFAGEATAPDLREGSPYPDLKPTGELNLIVFAIVPIVVFALSYLLWKVQLLIAKVLVFLIPVLCGLAGALLIPSRGAIESDHIVLAAALVAVGVSGSLACLLYAPIYDLRTKVAKLEGEA